MGISNLLHFGIRIDTDLALGISFSSYKLYIYLVFKPYYKRGVEMIPTHLGDLILEI